MKILKEIAEDEMVLAFLKAEINSLRWSDKVLKILDKYDINRNIIDKPDLDDERENRLRFKVLGELRGYRRNAKLFKEFPRPRDIKWFRVILSKQELRKVRYINYSYWNVLSGGSRLVIDGATAIK